MSYFLLLHFHIQMPYFVNELIVTSVDMGTELPVIRSAGKPFLDNQGLWIEAEVVYAGGFTVSLETYVSRGFFFLIRVFIHLQTFHFLR